MDDEVKNKASTSSSENKYISSQDPAVVEFHSFGEEVER